MLHKFYMLLAVVLALGTISGCGPSHTVVLVPDPDGHIGKAEVVNPAGKRLLEKTNDMTRVSNPSVPPATVTTADPAYIAATFGDVLAIEPSPAEKFILFFESGVIKLSEESEKTVPAMLDAIKRRGAITIAISGHADASGSAVLNDKLAFERAGLVEELLVKNGVDPKKITVSSHGKSNPLVPTADGVAEPRNRRVEVVIR